MIEAWQVEHRPWLYFLLRRYELIRWSLRLKVFRDDAFWYARLRSIWLALKGHETEICARCGNDVDCVWWCDDQEMWARVTGWSHGGGVLCVRCFDALAEKKQIFSRWSVALFELPLMPAYPICTTPFPVAQDEPRPAQEKEK